MIGLIVKREMLMFFRNPMGFLVTGLFCLVVGWLFMHQLDFFINNIQKAPVHLRNHYDFTNEVVIKLFSNVNFLFLFITPILGMSFFSAEYKNRTIDLYFSARISDFELILGKYISFLLQGLFILAMTTVYPLVLSNIQMNDTAFIYTGYIGIFLNFSCFASLSLLSSSFSRNPIICALFGFVLIMFTWILGFFGQISSHYFLSQILNFLSVNYHLTSFLKGAVSLSDIFFYLSFNLYILIVLKKRLESRKWL
ncbi:MAG: hypothetical protein CME62_17600 [Halobacteriovoraceae bacterium]|nr:hypothetical protein [Halobacteriovoraceae bacterium]